LSRPEHEQLPPHLRKGIDDELARMQAEEQICRMKPWSPMRGLFYTGVITFVLMFVLFMGLALQHGATFGPDKPVVIVPTPTKYGEPFYVR
jgi:hypothetical protein